MSHLTFSGRWARVRGAASEEAGGGGALGALVGRIRPWEAVVSRSARSHLGGLLAQPLEALERRAREALSRSDFRTLGLDVGRTLSAFSGDFPDADSPSRRDRLRRLLLVVSSHAHCGYSQGANFLAALVMLGAGAKSRAKRDFSKEAQLEDDALAAAVLLQLLDDHGLAVLFAKDIFLNHEGERQPAPPGAAFHLLTRLLGRLLARFERSTALSLRRRNFHVDMFATRWLLTGLGGAANLQVCLTVVDAILAREPNALLRAAAGLAGCVGDATRRLSADELLVGFKVAARKHAPEAVWRRALAIPSDVLAAALEPQWRYGNEGLTAAEEPRDSAFATDVLTFLWRSTFPKSTFDRFLPSPAAPGAGAASWGEEEPGKEPARPENDAEAGLGLDQGGPAGFPGPGASMRAHGGGKGGERGRGGPESGGDGEESDAMVGSAHEAPAMMRELVAQSVLDADGWACSVAHHFAPLRAHIQFTGYSVRDGVAFFHFVTRVPLAGVEAISVHRFSDLLPFHERLVAAGEGGLGMALCKAHKKQRQRILLTRKKPRPTEEDKRGEGTSTSTAPPPSTTPTSTPASPSWVGGGVWGEEEEEEGEVELDVSVSDLFSPVPVPAAFDRVSWQLPAPPPKTLFRSLDSAFLDARGEKIAKFLSTILLLPHALFYPHILNFLNIADDRSIHDMARAAWTLAHPHEPLTLTTVSMIQIGDVEGAGRGWRGGKGRGRGSVTSEGKKEEEREEEGEEEGGGGGRGGKRKTKSFSSTSSSTTPPTSPLTPSMPQRARKTRSLFLKPRHTSFSSTISFSSPSSLPSPDPTDPTPSSPHFRARPHPLTHSKSTPLPSSQLPSLSTHPPIHISLLPSSPLASISLLPSSNPHIRGKEGGERILHRWEESESEEEVEEEKRGGRRRKKRGKKKDEVSSTSSTSSSSSSTSSISSKFVSSDGVLKRSFSKVLSGGEGVVLSTAPPSPPSPTPMDKSSSSSSSSSSSPTPEEHHHIPTFSPFASLFGGRVRAKPPTQFKPDRRHSTPIAPTTSSKSSTSPTPPHPPSPSPFTKHHEAAIEFLHPGRNNLRLSFDPTTALASQTRRELAKKKREKSKEGSGEE